MPSSVTLLMALVMVNHAALNLGQPHWRAWLGRLVPPRARGRFFVARSQVLMLLSVLVFVAGGWILSTGARHGLEWLGFALLFAIGGAGRFLAARAIGRMSDPDAGVPPVSDAQLRGTLARLRESWQDSQFRSYTLFVAALQGAVAVTAPFFTVYMLQDLRFTYLQFAINSVASIATQFVMLHIWGRVADRIGNPPIMRLTSILIAILPLLWLVSADPLFLIFAQVVAGIAWSGFSLSAANYLYDIRPHHTHFATYAAVQAGVTAVCVCVGALLGGVAAELAPAVVKHLPAPLASMPAALAVILLGGVLRLLVVAAFVPRMPVPVERKHPKLMQLILRVTQINAVSGVALDWLTVARRSLPDTIGKIRKRP